MSVTRRQALKLGAAAAIAPVDSLEMEGKESAATAVPKSLEVLRAAFGR